MDIDALDAFDVQLPPRHALESDEEDEFNPLTTTRPAPTFDVKVLGDIPTQRNLIVATGDPGAFWARGVSLGEQTGAVAVNGVQVGLVFNPSWTKANVIISEALSRLPVWAMHPYAQTVIVDRLQPTSVSLLDEYALPSYITNTLSPVDNSPVRYLSTSDFDPAGQAEPFTPPNLISTTSASFLSLLSISLIPCTLFLLPSPNIPNPPPRILEPRNITHLSQNVTEWPSCLMNNVHQLLLHAVNEPADQRQQWQLTDEPSLASPKFNTTSRISATGEGGMYI